MKIYLIGMPGCGKSTFGKKAAEMLSIEFIDLDKEIVEAEGKSISEIFEQDGEAHFRQVESRLLKKLGSGRSTFIMATGGGAPCFFDNMDYMNTTGTTFFIDTTIEHLLERLSQKGISKRPLLRKIGEENLEQGLREKLKERLPFYSRATHTIPYHKDLENDIIFYVRSRK